jgi:hypothetical protein
MQNNIIGIKLKEIDNLEDLGVDRRIIILFMLVQRM